MSEPGGWTTPAGWGPPASSGPPAGSPPPPPPPPPPSYGGPPYGGPAWGGAPYGRPEVKPGVVPLRPLGLGELLDGAVGVLRRYPWPTLGMSAAVALVTGLINLLLLVTAFRPLLDSTATEDFAQGDPAAFEAALGGVAVGGALTAVLTLISSAVLTGVLTAVVGKAVLGEPFTLGQAWQQVRPQLLRLIGLSLLVGLLASAVAIVGTLLGVVIIAVGGPVFALLGVPLVLVSLAAGVYLYIRLSLAPCALVLERTGVGASLRRSSVLVKGDWWRVFGISLLTFMVAGFVSVVLQVPFEAVGYGSVDGFLGGTDAFALRSLIASTLGGIVGATLVEPFTAGVRALLYVDRRMRAEGLDVALTAAAAERA